jgi:NADP-dependent 3-hydroxy acid dehydrogenase YdfG
MSHDHQAQSERRVAVVTDASSGIGEATARALAADGYRVALLARRVERIEAVAAELGNGSIAIAADVTDRDSIVAAAQRVQEELGGADVLVNNAGVMLLGPFDTEQRDDYRQMIEVNLLGVITATEVFLDQLKSDAGERGHSDIYVRSAWETGGGAKRPHPDHPPRCEERLPASRSRAGPNRRMSAKESL